MTKTEQDAWVEVTVESNKAIDAYLREIWPELPEHYGMPVDGVRKVVERLLTVANAAQKWRNTAFDEAGSAADLAAHNTLCDVIDAYSSVCEAQTDE